jgi:hypothetical protein
MTSKHAVPPVPGISARFGRTSLTHKAGVWFSVGVEDGFFVGVGVGVLVAWHTTQGPHGYARQPARIVGHSKAPQSLAQKGVPVGAQVGVSVSVGDADSVRVGVVLAATESVGDGLANAVGTSVAVGTAVGLGVSDGVDSTVGVRVAPEPPLLPPHAASVATASAAIN